MRHFLIGATAIALASLPLGIGAEEHSGSKSQQTSASSAQQMQQLQHQIQQDLTQAGLTEDAARRHAETLASDAQKLQQNYTQDLEKVRQAYVDALSQGRMSQDEARSQARELSQELARVQLSEHAGTSTSASPGQLSESDKSQIRQRLQQAEVDSQKIQQLEQKGFPQQKVRDAVEQVQQRAGRSSQQAQQQAREVAQQVQDIKTSAGTPGAVSAGGSQVPAITQSEEETLRQHLQRAGVDSSQIQDLEGNGFPKEKTQQAVKQAQEQEAQQQAQEIARLIERMNQKENSR